MTGRNTSAQSHAFNEVSGIYTSKKAAILALLNGTEMTRRQIATQLNYDTATVSGLITPLLKTGHLIETAQVTCPITKRQAYAVTAPKGQLRLL